MFLYPFKKKLILYSLNFFFKNLKQVLFSFLYLNKFFWNLLFFNTFFFNKILIKFYFFLYLIEIGIFNNKKILKLNDR